MVFRACCACPVSEPAHALAEASSYRETALALGADSPAQLLFATDVEAEGYLYFRVRIFINLRLRNLHAQAEAGSYREIALALGADSPAQLLFATDVEAEAAAATTAGWQVCQWERDCVCAYSPDAESQCQQVPWEIRRCY